MPDKRSDDRTGTPRMMLGLTSAAGLGNAVARIWGVALVGWSVTAGTWRALHDVLSRDDWHRAASLQFWNALGGAIFYSLGALACLLLILIAAWLVGGAFGVLFGLPRMEPGGDGGVRIERTQAVAAADSQPLLASGDDETASRTVATSSRLSRFRVSPALNEIADWLTKIIVGVGLVQAESIGTGFIRLSRFFLQDAGLDRFPAAGIAVPCCMVSGVIAGFIVTYHFMALIMGPRLADAGYDTESRQILRDKAQAAEERAREQSAKAERAAQEAQSQKAKANAATAEVARAAEFAAVVEAWKSFDMATLLSPLAIAERPEMTAAAREFGGQEFARCVSLDEKRAWVMINTALGNLEAALAANKTLG